MGVVVAPMHDESFIGNVDSGPIVDEDGIVLWRILRWHGTGGGGLRDGRRSR